MCTIEGLFNRLNHRNVTRPGLKKQVISEMNILFLKKNFYSFTCGCAGSSLGAARGATLHCGSLSCCRAQALGEWAQ